MQTTLELDAADLGAGKPKIVCRHPKTFRGTKGVPRHPKNFCRHPKSFELDAADLGAAPGMGVVSDGGGFPAPDYDAYVMRVWLSVCVLASDCYAMCRTAAKL